MGRSLQSLCSGGDLRSLASAFRPGDALSQSSLGILGTPPFFLRRLFIVRPFLDLFEEPILGADALEALQEAFAGFAGANGYLDGQVDLRIYLDASKSRNRKAFVKGQKYRTAAPMTIPFHRF